MDDAYDLRTPEQVDLEYEVAGLGSRFMAALVDALIQAAVMLAVVAAFGLGAALLGVAGGRLLGGDRGTLVAVVGVAIAVLLVFAITWGYFVFFELVWNGQTPGKRMVGIRVLTTRGEPIGLVHVLVRNLVRIVDYLPTSYMIGAVAILVTRRSQRLGDLAAGTFVVKERRAGPPSTLAALSPEDALAPQQAALVSAEDVALARDFLLRRETLPPERRRVLAREIAEPIRARLGDDGRARLGDDGRGIPDSPDADEWLLARVAGVRR